MIFCKIVGLLRGGGRKIIHIYDNIISFDNLLISWREFLRGKKKRKDVAIFQLHFMDNILLLHQELRNKTYHHGGYKAFKINDPKPRDIHKASVRDRLVHHAIYRKIYPFFDRLFIYDSYSCRINKGTHRAINRFRYFSSKVSKNNTKTCWVLKCDIKKFFANIDHKILKNILGKHIKDENTFWLLSQIIDSFDKGLPLGNLTSQLLVNIYMNEFDQFIKRRLKIKYYIRYADDFVIFSRDKIFLEKLILEISDFLEQHLKLSLHPNKLSIETISSGIDFLGWIIFPKHMILRTKTKKRIFYRLEQNYNEQSLASYSGLLSHGNAFGLSNKILREYKSKLNKKTASYEVVF